MEIINDILWFISGFGIVFLFGVWLMKDEWDD
jgi:hypothetical protein